MALRTESLSDHFGPRIIWIRFDSGPRSGEVLDFEPGTSFSHLVLFSRVVLFNVFVIELWQKCHTNLHVSKVEASLFVRRLSTTHTQKA